MNYNEKFQTITTIQELYNFRDELNEDSIKYSVVKDKDIDFDKIEKCQNANFYLARVENRIKFLESKGLFIDKIIINKP